MANENDSFSTNSWIYHDFELRIGAKSESQYSVDVIRSPAGEASETINLADLSLQVFSNILRKEQSARKLGKKLFDTFLVGKVRARYDVSRARLQQGEGLRLKLRIQPPELAALPWELLYDSRKAEYVCLSGQTPIVRYPELPQPIEGLLVTPPLRILGMVASPLDWPPLQVEREKQQVEEALATLRARGLVELVWLSGQTWRDLQRAMRRGPWHIFHFMGHGGFDPYTEKGFVVLSDESRKTDRLSANQLARLLTDQWGLRIVLLNACAGAQGSKQDIFSSTASTLIRQGIPAVLAMQHPITDRGAIELARAFYEALADGYPGEMAVAEARKALSISVPNRAEWGIPVLYMRSPDGRILEIEVMAPEQIVQNLDDFAQQVRDAAHQAVQKRDFEIQPLARGIKEFAERLRASTQSSTSDGVPYKGPYKGLVEYQLSDASRFFGRTKAIQLMMDRLLNQNSISRLIILHSESGSGKTSLIRAGLIPRLLVRGHLPIYVRAWHRTPTLALKRHLLDDIEQLPDSAKGSLRGFLHQVVEILGRETTLFIFFDQFEEFFSEALTQEVRDHFVTELGECLDDDSLPVRFIFALRGEYFSRLSAFHPRVRNPCANEYLLAPFTREEARQAIVKPALQQEIDYEEGLVETLLDEFKQQAIAPPQLQLVCRALYQSLPAEESCITKAMYKELGGVEGILQGYLEQVLTRELPLAHRQAAKEILSSLVTPAGQRDRKTEDALQQQLAGLDIEPTLLATVLNQLVDNRILRRVHVGELAEEEAYELVHDYLVAEIMPWISQDQINATRIRNMLAEGVEQYKQYKLLLSADQLEIVQTQRRNPYLNLTQEKRRLLLTSAIEQKVEIYPWLELSDDALEWIGEIQRTASHPEPLRLAAAGVLGRLEDKKTFTELQTTALSAPPSAHAYTRRALAHFMQHSQALRPDNLDSKRLTLQVDIQLAVLRLRANRQKIVALAQAAALTAAVGSFMTNLRLLGKINDFRSFMSTLTLVPFLAIGAFSLGVIWGGLFAGIHVVLTGRAMWLQLLGLSGIGSLLGVLLFSVITLDGNYGWVAGALIGTVFILVNRIASKAPRMSSWALPAVTSLLTILLSWGVLRLSDKYQETDIPGLLAIALFAFVFIRQAALLALPVPVARSDTNEMSDR